MNEGCSRGNYSDMSFVSKGISRADYSRESPAVKEHICGLKGLQSHLGYTKNPEPRLISFFSCLKSSGRESLI